MTRVAVLLDRDGTLIAERLHLSDPDDVELLPGVATLARLQRRQLPLIIVTNQSAVGRGYLDEARLEEIHRRLRSLLAQEGVHIDGIYHCPHLPDEGCLCRKPERALADRAARAHGLALHAGFCIGDKACDVELGRAIGACSILVRTGHGASAEQATRDRASYVVDSIVEAVAIIERALDERASGGAA